MGAVLRRRSLYSGAVWRTVRREWWSSAEVLRQRHRKEGHRTCVTVASKGAPQRPRTLAQQKGGGRGSRPPSSQQNEDEDAVTVTQHCKLFYFRSQNRRTHRTALNAPRELCCSRSINVKREEKLRPSTAPLGESCGCSHSSVK
jgi:hypothetical protein